MLLAGEFFGNKYLFSNFTRICRHEVIGKRTRFVEFQFQSLYYKHIGHNQLTHTHTSPTLHSIETFLGALVKHLI